MSGQHRSTQRHEPEVACDDLALRAELRPHLPEAAAMGESSRAPANARRGLARSTASGPSGCGVRRVSGCHAGGASACGWATRRCRPSGCGPSGPITCGRSITSSIRPPTGRILKLLHVVDEFTREALAIECRRRVDADHTVTVLDRLVAERGTAPAFIRCDNGPELTANALRDSCRFTRAGSAYIEPGSPWQNPYIESLRLPHPRRAPSRRAVLPSRRGPSARRGLAPGLQPPSAALRARDARPSRLRRQPPPTTPAAHSNGIWGRERPGLPPCRRGPRPTAGHLPDAATAGSG